LPVGRSHALAYGMVAAVCHTLRFSLPDIAR